MFFLNILFFSGVIFADDISQKTEADLRVFSDKKKERGVKVSENLNDYFQENPSYIYFEKEAPGLNQSFFYKGLSQRNFNIYYNGFFLSDPSSPDGTLNISSFLQTRDNHIFNNSNSIKINSLVGDEKKLSLMGSSFGESSLDLSYGDCKKDRCYRAQAFAKRFGGTSQVENGSEKDFGENIGLSFSRIKKTSYKLASHFFINSEAFSEDDLFLQSDDLNAESKRNSIFLGQEFSKDNYGMRISFFDQKREQINRPDNQSLSEYEFRQESQTVSLLSFYKKTQLLLRRESFQFGDLDGFDSVVNLNSAYKAFSASLSFSNKRDLFGELLYSAKNFEIFYRKIAPSLYQLLEENFGNTNLNAEDLAGLSYKNVMRLSERNLFDFELSYYRLWNLIDFYDPDGFGQGELGSYLNRRRAENFYFAAHREMKFQKFKIKPYTRFLYARDLETRRLLARRPRWTFGLNLSTQYKKFDLELKTKAVSSRNSYSGEELEPILISSLKVNRAIKRGSIFLQLYNLTNDKSPIFEGIERRGVEARLGVDLNL